MGWAIPVPIPKSPKVIPAHPWFEGCNVLDVTLLGCKVVRFHSSNLHNSKSRYLINCNPEKFPPPGVITRTRDIKTAFWNFLSPAAFPMVQVKRNIHNTFWVRVPHALGSWWAWFLKSFFLNPTLGPIWKKNESALPSTIQSNLELWSSGVRRC